MYMYVLVICFQLFLNPTCIFIPHTQLYRCGHGLWASVLFLACDIANIGPYIFNRNAMYPKERNVLVFLHTPFGCPNSIFFIFCKLSSVSNPSHCFTVTRSIHILIYHTTYKIDGGAHIRGHLADFLRFRQEVRGTY